LPYWGHLTIFQVITGVQEFIVHAVQCMNMEPGNETDAGKEQEIQVQKDLRHLSSSLNGENLKADVMFAKGRNIRSCTPPFDTPPGNDTAVSERLKRVQPPPSE
jgi:hypothetical protein